MAKTKAQAATTSVFFAGIGGQGVLLASEIVAKVALGAGHDVKKSEVHGMSQRGGSVVTLVRFGRKVYSPLIREGTADYLVAFDEAEGRRHAHMLARAGVAINSGGALDVDLPDPRTLNMFILGKLARHLPFSKAAWLDTIGTCVPPRTVEANGLAFGLGWDYDEGETP